MNGKGLPHSQGWRGAPFLCIDLMAHPRVVAAVPVSADVIQQFCFLIKIYIGKVV